MRRNVKLLPLLTGTIRYEKSISTRNRGYGQFINAPILAYLIDTPNGHILYDVGCDYRKLKDPALRSRYFDSMRPRVEVPVMNEEQRLSRYLAQLSLKPSDHNENRLVFAEIAGRVKTYRTITACFMIGFTSLT